MNKITQLLIDDIGIGKHDAIVRAMNMNEDEFLEWASADFGKVNHSRKSLDIPFSSYPEMEKTLFKVVNEYAEEIKQQFSETLCNNVPKE